MSLERTPAGMELIDLLDRVLDRGIVIDASSRLHLARANLLRHEHFVLATVETHLSHSGARAVARLAERRPMASPHDLRKSSNRSKHHRSGKQSGHR